MNWINRSLILKFSIFLFFLLLTIKLFDLTLGLVGNSSEYEQSQPKRSLLLKEHSPHLVKLMKPTNDYMLGTQNLTQKDFQLRTDADGFIIGSKDSVDIKENVSIIFFGGSTTECVYVEEDRRFPYLVSLNLNTRVLNGGVSGNHSIHSLLSMIGKGIPYKPKHIVLMHAVNDLSTLSKTLSYWDSPEERSLIQREKMTAKNPIVSDVARHVKDFLIPNFWLKTRHIFGHHVALISPDEWVAFRDRKYSYMDIDKALGEQFAASLKSFVKLSRVWGIEPILMTQFNRIKEVDVFVRAAYEKNPQPISYDNFVLLYQRANDIVRVVANEEKVFLIDLDVLIPSTNEYIYDAVHLNTKGSELVAEKITFELRKRYPSLYR